MSRKGFTLIELLGVIVILAIIMVIAVPNVMSVLEKGKKDNYLSDAKRLITQAEYAIRNSDVDKPSSSDIYKITLGYLGTNDVEKDPDGNNYSLTDSYVAVVRKDGYLEYYVNLVAITDGGNIGIRLTHEDNLDSEKKRTFVLKNFIIPSVSDIQDITGVNGTITTY